MCYVQVDPDNVRAVEEVIVDPLVEAEKEAEATKQALKRKIAQAAVADVDFQSKSLPAKLRIEPEDSEDVVSMSAELPSAIQICSYISNFRFRSWFLISRRVYMMGRLCW